MTEDKLHFSHQVLFLWIASAVALIISFFLIQFKIKPHGDFPVALHYNILVGVDAFGKARNLYVIPGAGLFIGAINFFLFRSLRRRDPFLSFLTALVSVAVSVILLIATLFLLNVNS
jgi:hypothetical protein